MRGKTFILALVAAGLLLRLGWYAETRAQGKGHVDIRGTIMKVTPANEDAKKRGILLTVLVEGPADKTVHYDKAMIRITDKTKIQKLVGKERQAARVEDLTGGVRVEAVFTGPVAESYPVQATAGEVVILPKDK